MRESQEDKDDSEDRQHDDGGPRVSQDHPGKRHPGTALAGPADLAAPDMAAHEGRDGQEGPERDLADT